MKQLKNMQIIGIDNGYGNLKTAVPASPFAHDDEPDENDLDDALDSFGC